MKANELRLGNYLKAINNTIDTFQLFGMYNERYLLIGDEYNNYDTTIKDIKPIEITEQWLVNLGFARIFKDLKGCYIDKSEKYMICKSDVNSFDIFIFGYEEDLYITTLTFIHQLQNLYFALTGVELDLSLNVA